MFDFLKRETRQDGDCFCRQDGIHDVDQVTVDFQASFILPEFGRRVASNLGQFEGFQENLRLQSWQITIQYLQVYQQKHPAVEIHLQFTICKSPNLSPHLWFILVATGRIELPLPNHRSGVAFGGFPTGLDTGSRPVCYPTRVATHGDATGRLFYVPKSTEQAKRDQNQHKPKITKTKKNSK